MKTKVYGHRGAKAYYPENTLISFLKALEMGADGIELDVHLSKDGEILVFHDFELERMTKEKGMVFEKTLEEMQNMEVLCDGHIDPLENAFAAVQDLSPEKTIMLKKLTGDLHGGIPALKEVLHLLKKAETIFGRSYDLNVELKAGSSFYPGIESKVIELVLPILGPEKLIVSSFDHYSLLKIKEIAPEVRTGVLTAEMMVDPWEYVRKLDADFYHPHYLALNESMLRAFYQNNLEVNTYTLNDSKIASNLIKEGLCGIITDRPDVILRAKWEGTI